MARVLVTSAGYRGDVMPFVSVARELAARGHDIDLVVPSGFHDSFANEPVTLHRLGVEFSPRELFGVHRDEWDRHGTALGALRMTRWMVREGMLEHLDSIYDSLASVAEHADLVLTHNVLVPARWTAEIHDIPCVTLHVVPILVPSEERLPEMRPMPVLPGRVGRRVNRVAWAGALRTTELVFAADRPLSEQRRRLGLPEHRNELLTTTLTSDRLLLPVSPQWFPRPSDWPETCVLTGFIPWEPPVSELADDVNAFLDDGDAPVLVTLGTSAATNAKQVFELMANTLDELGLRGLFLVGDESNITGPLRDRSGVWPFVPVHLVLPRCRAVVHSASLGTTAAVLESGLPALAVPLLFDQIWNAYRTAQLHAGLVLRRPSRPRARRLVDQLVTDRSLEEHARDLSAQLRPEHGAVRAADAIEAALDRRAGSPRSKPDRRPSTAKRSPRLRSPTRSDTLR
jgi:UDP:flavonoid glycosyltransferase YjiC (YdhE family)